MNVKDYIESGSLELYASGALNEDERKEAEAMIAQYPEVKAELEAIEKALEDYAFAHAVNTPPAVLTNILTKIKAEAPVVNPGKVINMKPSQSSQNNWVRYLAYAASILLFISVATNVYYYNSFKKAEDQLAELEDANTFLTERVDVVRAQNLAMESEINVMKNPAAIAITMKGQVISPNSTSVVFWDKSSGNVYLSALNLPIPEAGKQYQLWALKDGKPIDAGVFDINGKLQKMNNIEGADAFAVTLEPAGGSVGPTMDQLYLVGVI
ncbi:MAG: anti-sigma factor [Chitinophagales bacterium]|nr:anti-sigma factor [Chitinophagales bacterium]